MMFEKSLKIPSAEYNLEKVKNHRDFSQNVFPLHHSKRICTFGTLFLEFYIEVNLLVLNFTETR